MRIIFLTCILLFLGTEIYAHRPDVFKRLKKERTASLRADCAPSRSSIDMSINNVRARLLGGGDVWWDLQDGKYIVPKVDPTSGQPEVSSIFAGAVWLGGFDPVGNLKLAAQTYRNDNANDFWPGPLDPIMGSIGTDTCAVWDRHFTVLGVNIDRHLSEFARAQNQGIEYDCDLIPDDVKSWPARGNPFFEEMMGFQLPNTSQGLGAFFDQDGDGLYNPCEGDYPIIEIRGCPQPQYPDEMIFWIYNDAGGIHTQTQGVPIQMEVQVQAFAYSTNDEVNDMTFQRYKLINRATAAIDSTYFAMWVDPDLGCFVDDYIGCDTSRSLAYVYNEDVLDGETGCSCTGGVNSYCDEVPILGVDYFRGPLDEFGEEIGMSSFTYYNNAAVGSWPTAMTDPQIAPEYYNYMSGSWKDGTSFSFGGTGYRIGGSPIDYAFTNAPNNQSGWSMCTANLDFGDRRTIQASGPFRLLPGAVNELIIGVVWVPDLDYPCPDIARLLSADDIAQALFDNCFDITDGPDAPDLDFIELDQQLVAILSNDSTESNNRFEQYEEVDLQAPVGVEDSLYRFEGYKVYQLSGPNVSTGELDDMEKARLIYQADLRNGVSNIYNWRSVPDPGSSEPVWIPEIQVEGADLGIRHTFRITEDQFASEDRRLINHKKYYFTTIAYAYNNYETFDPRDVVGQRRPYLEGRRNVRIYTVTPRPIVDRTLNSNFGEGAVVTRLDGKGAGDNFLDISSEVRESMVSGEFSGEITYNPGEGPLRVLIYNPLDVVEGEFMLTFNDSDLQDNELDDDAKWQLVNLSNPTEVIQSETTLDRLNEQLISRYGFSIIIGQTADAGQQVDETNGAIGLEIEYQDPGGPQWFATINDAPDGIFNYLKTNSGEVDVDLDPDQGLSSLGTFIPFLLTDFRRPANQPPYLSPSWHGASESFDIVRLRSSLTELNNVDIVFTSNKDLWSRCIVVETATPYYTSAFNGLGLSARGNAMNFDVRTDRSVTKFDSDGDGRADPVEDPGDTGMGWFPGYAVDVETGERLNIFFGENSVYDGRFYSTQFQGLPNGGDMMWNPSSQIVIQTPDLPFTTIFNFLAGGQHYIYVTKQIYDECAELRERLVGGQSELRKVNGLVEITWAGFPALPGGQELLSYDQGLIPNDLVVKVRVQNPYGVSEEKRSNQGHPSYRFALQDVASTALETSEEINEALNAINVVPNPYFAFSSYETSQFSNVVKISNLPARCAVTIYSLDGKFIKRFTRDEQRLDVAGRSNPGILRNQIVPDVEWDLKNDKGIPVASGVYLIHVDAPGLGERVLKWFGVIRKFDPTGL